MVKITILLFCILFIGTGCRKSNDVKESLETHENTKADIVKEKWHWDSKEKQNVGAGYAQVVKVGNTLYISGVPTSDLSPDGVSRLYESLEKCLHAFGASSKNVVKETLYTTDIEAMKKCNDARKAFYKADFPAASWVQVSRLYEPDSKLEVELIAQIDGNDQ